MKGRARHDSHPVHLPRAFDRGFHFGVRGRRAIRGRVLRISRHIRNSETGVMGFTPAETLQISRSRSAVGVIEQLLQAIAERRRKPGRPGRVDQANPNQVAKVGSILVAQAINFIRMRASSLAT